jgi:hypothetical protein
MLTQDKECQVPPENGRGKEGFSSQSYHQKNNLSLHFGPLASKIVNVIQPFCNIVKTTQLRIIFMVVLGTSV